MTILKTFASWGWINKHIPPAVRVKHTNLALVKKVRPIFDIDFTQYVKNPVVVITGDGKCLPEDIKKFESWDIDHDLYCVNRSLLYFQRPVNHWGAVDVEEGTWFAQNLSKAVLPENGGRLLRHTMQHMPIAFDVHWTVDGYEFENENQRFLWTGNSGYFAMLTAIAMGYEKIVLAGMPLDNDRHWYEPDGTVGPNWVGRAYRQWMDFKIEAPDADKVRSLSGYSAFILGEATEEWLRH